MATLAEMLVGAAIDSTDPAKAPDIGGAYTKGAAIAQQAEQVKAKRAELLHEQEKLKGEKYTKMVDAIQKVDNFKDPTAKKNYVKALSGYRDALGLDHNVITDDVLNLYGTSSEMRAKLNTVIAQIQDPHNGMTAEQGIKQITNVITMADVPDTVKEDYVVQATEAGKTKATLRAQEIKGQSYQTGAETRKDEQTASAVNRVNTDTQLTGLQTQSRNISKGLDLLKHGTPSVTTINELAQDFSSALSGKGIASDFKLKELSTNTVQGEIAKLTQFISSNPDQPAPPDVVKFWKNFGERLDGAYDRQISGRAKQISKEAPTIYKNNPQAVEAVSSAAQSYIDGTWKGGVEAKYEVHGQRMTAGQAQAFFKAHPEFMKPEYKTIPGVK